MTMKPKGPFGTVHPTDPEQWVCGCDESMSNGRAMCEACGFFSPAVQKSAGPTGEASDEESVQETGIARQTASRDVAAGARRMTSDIRRGLESLVITAVDLGKRLIAARDAEVWKALDYKSWTAYLEAEFDVSRRRLYGHIAQALAADETGDNQITMRKATEVLAIGPQYPDPYPDPAPGPVPPEPKSRSRKKAPKVIDVAFTETVGPGLPRRVDPPTGSDSLPSEEAAKQEPVNTVHDALRESREEIEAMEAEAAEVVAVPAEYAEDVSHDDPVIPFTAISDNPATAFLNAYDMMSRTMAKYPHQSLIAEAMPEDDLDELTSGGPIVTMSFWLDGMVHALANAKESKQ